MAFISLSDELKKKSVTSVENKFIVKYLCELEPMAVKVYLYSLYLAQNGGENFDLDRLAQKLNITREQALDHFKYLEETELVDIISREPFEVCVCEAENFSGKPKKLHPEKYAGLYEELQKIISGRMISQDELREYLILLEEYGLERGALVKIASYCVSLKGESISAAYIKKVAKNFCAEGITQTKQVEERLFIYDNNSAALGAIFSALSLKRRPDVEDGEYLKNWLALGFTAEAAKVAAKCFKIKSMEKLNATMDELYKNRKLDPKEIEDFAKNRQQLYDLAVEIAKRLGVFAADPTPYVENYVSVWTGYGFSPDTLKNVATYCFLSGRNSFDLMHDFVSGLYDDAFIDDSSVQKLLSELEENDKFIKKILAVCGLTRKILAYDRQALTRWRGWGFSESMILKAAELSAGKNNPVAAMNYLLSTWKNAGVFTPEAIPAENQTPQKARKNDGAKTEAVTSASGKTDEELWAELSSVLSKVYEVSRYLSYPQHYDWATNRLKQIFDGLDGDIKGYLVNTSTLIELSSMTSESLVFERARFLRQLPAIRKRANGGGN